MTTEMPSAHRRDRSSGICVSGCCIPDCGGYEHKVSHSGVTPHTRARFPPWVATSFAVARRGSAARLARSQRGGARRRGDRHGARSRPAGGSSTICSVQPHRGSSAGTRPAYRPGDATSAPPSRRRVGDGTQSSHCSEEHMSIGGLLAPLLQVLESRRPTAERLSTQFSICRTSSHAGDRLGNRRACERRRVHTFIQRTISPTRRSGVPCRSARAPSSGGTLPQGGGSKALRTLFSRL